MKLAPITNGTGFVIGYAHFCEACHGEHIFFVAPECEQRWSFINRDLERPTFDPSMRSGGCHYFLKNGAQVFEKDSERMAGGTIELRHFVDLMMGDSPGPRR